MNSVNFIFVFSGFIDFQRRRTMIKACGALIEPVKSNLDVMYRIFPTINLTCSQSLNTWFMIRLSLMDLGRKYMNRIFIYSSTFMGAYLFYAVILLLNFFEFINIKLSLISNIYAIFDITIVLSCNMGMLIFGAAVND
jgi:hypothetical protein